MQARIYTAFSGSVFIPRLPAFPDYVTARGTVTRFRLYADRPSPRATRKEENDNNARSVPRWVLSPSRSRFRATVCRSQLRLDWPGNAGCVALLIAEIWTAQASRRKSHFGRCYHE